MKKDFVLVSKNPYVVEQGLNLAPKNHYFALKTGENFTQNSRLKSLIFIVEKYGKKLLFGFVGQNKQRYHTLNALTLAARFKAASFGVVILNAIILFLLPDFAFKQIIYYSLQTIANYLHTAFVANKKSCPAIICRAAFLSFVV
ncbi:MAG: hypothetical protein ACI3Z9_00570 [Candidatus Onthomorpha sp.]